MYLIGKIKEILEIQEFKNNFRKRSIILITDEQYPQNILIDFVQNKIDLLENIKKNDLVKIFINIKGREWINKEGLTKYFNTIQAWKIEKIQNEDLNQINYEYLNNSNNYDQEILDEYDNEEDKKKKDKKKEKYEEDLPF